MHWIDAKDIEQWADSEECASLLPMLIRRLIVATSPKISRLDIPSGSSVCLGGWDGRIEVKESSPFVPEGVSAWEMSCNKGIKRKADSDYKKRTENPGSVRPEKSSFIFVTPRVWSSKEKWLKANIEEEKWKDIHVYDATDLVQWIDLSPSVGAWLAVQIGKLPPQGYLAASDYWDNWSKETEPSITPDVVLAGRNEFQEPLREWINGPPSSFSIEGETKDEAIAFLLASAISAEDEWGADLFACGLVIEDSTTWRALAEHNTPLVLIPNFEGNYSSKVAVDSGHHVLVPLERGQSVPGKRITLKKPDVDTFRKTLNKLGFNYDDARNLARSTGRSLPVLKRRIIAQGGGKKPSWANHPNAKNLIPALLLCRWVENQNDLVVLSEIAERPHSDLIRDYQSLLNQPDAPLRKVGKNWRLTSHEESWELLSSLITKSDLDKFESIAIKVLSEVSTVYIFDKEERFYAAVKGKTLLYSQELRDGISYTLALMGSRPEPTGSEEVVRHFSNKIAREILKDNHSWQLWASLDSVLPVLSEAAPEVVLDKFEDTLTESPSTFLELFKQEGDGIGGACLHSGLLWALERMAWCEDMFTRVALILAKLAAIDPGGRYSNRPLESLRALFLGWMHYSSTPDDERLQVIDLLLDRESGVAWDLLMSICPQAHDMIVERATPQWRPWAQDKIINPTRADVISYMGEILKKVVNEVGSNPKRWGGLLENLSSFPDEFRSDAIARLNDISKGLDKGRKTKWKDVWEKLREILNHHNSFSDADWAMPSGELGLLNNIYEILSPEDPVDRYSWAFEYWPRLPEGGMFNDQYYIKNKIMIQESCVEGTYKSAGLEGLKSLASNAAAPDIVGRTAMRILGAKDDVNDFVIQTLDSNERPLRLLAIGACAEVFRIHGWPGLEKVLQYAKSKNISSVAIAAIYISTDECMETWLRLENEAPEIQKSYWENVSNTFMLQTKNASELEYGLVHFLDAGRPLEVIDALAYEGNDIPSEIMVEVLEATQKQSKEATEANKRGAPSSIARIFKKLDDDPGVSEKLVARLEVPFISVLSRNRPVLALHKQVLNDPTTFTDLVCWSFKPADRRIEDDDITDEERKNRALLAWHVLHNIRILPGQKESGEIVDRELETFIAEARILCSERGRGVICDQIIGQILANSPFGKDGFWPCEEIRNTLESLKSSEIGKGFEIGKRNLRGMTSRGAYEGGEQERIIARDYRKAAKSLRSRWPYVTKLLNNLAEDYENEAKRHDDEAELEE